VVNMLYIYIYQGVDINKLPVIENGLEPMMATCVPRRLLALVAMRSPVQLTPKLAPMLSFS